MRYLSLLILLTTSLSSLAQDLVEFENGQSADADEINANFEVLENKISALEGLDTAYITKIPASAFALDLQERVKGFSQSVALPSLQAGYDFLTWGSSIFNSSGTYVHLQLMRKTRWLDGNYSSEQHVLCDPENDIGFIPVEMSYILSNGSDLLAFKTQTAAQSAEVTNTDASVMCVRSDSGGLRLERIGNFELVNRQGRFACATVTDPIVEFAVLNDSASRDRTIDLFGISATGSINGVLYSATDTAASTIPMTGSIQVPQTCD